MLAPIRWLSEFISLPPKEELEQLLVDGGFDVTAQSGDILNIEVTPNRADVLNIYGLARELSIFTTQDLKKEFPQDWFEKTDLRNKVKVKFEETKIVPRYVCCIIDKVKIAPSPEWLEKRLLEVGIRSVNNVVDVTNYVMFELGQPLHAFDFNQIQKETLIIRRAKEGETLITLDEEERLLDSNAIVIENNGEVIDLAGIMGGRGSKVSQSTKAILLQAAIFDPLLIRRTSKKQGIVTEASYRYERGVDFKGTLKALRRAASLIQELAKGNISDVLDIRNKEKPALSIQIEEKDVNNLLGTRLPLTEIENLLSKALSIKKEGQSLKIEVPSYRFDIKIKEDLVEEVARIYGYHQLKEKSLSKKKKIENREYQIENAIKDILHGLGFTEVYNYPYLSSLDLRVIEYPSKKAMPIANPLSADQQYLRPNLLPNLLKAVSKNPFEDRIRLFELGTVFLNSGEEKELTMIVLAKEEKLLLEAILRIQNKLKIKDFRTFQPLNVLPSVLDHFKIKRPFKYISINLDDFLSKASLKKYTLSSVVQSFNFQPLSKFPPAARDVSLMVKDKMKADDIAKEIKKIDNLVWMVELFDEYKDKSLGKANKSLAFHILFQSYSKTLEEGEVNLLMEKIITKLKRKFKALVR